MKDFFIFEDSTAFERELLDDGDFFFYDSDDEVADCYDEPDAHSCNANRNVNGMCEVCGDMKESV